jgi:hypothetical protein
MNCDMYYTDSEVLENVPSMFLMLGKQVNKDIFYIARMKYNKEFGINNSKVKSD